VLRVNLMTAT